MCIRDRHSTQTWAPVNHGFAEVSDAVVHQNLLLLHVVKAVPLLGSEDVYKRQVL